MSKIPKMVVTKKSRSNFNLQRVNRLTAAPGLAIPVLVEDVLPDDTFKLDIESLIKTAPMLSPTLGSFKVSFHMFFAPWRLYSRTLGSNSVRNSQSFTNLGISTLPLHYLSYSRPTQPADYTRDVVSSGCLMDYLGLPPGFVNLSSSPKRISAMPFLAYWDIIRNYFVHQQSGYYAVMSKAQGSDYPFVTASLAELDDFFEDVRMSDGQDVYQIDGCPSKADSARNGGLACVTYMPDYFTNYLDNDLVARMNSLNRIVAEYDNENSEYYLTMDQIRYGNKMQKYLETSLLGGSRYTDWLRSNWAVELQLDSVRPEYLGTTSTWCNFQDVVSTSNTKADGASGATGLGDLGGRGLGYGKGKRRAFHFKENGTFMVIMTIVPEVDYTEGIRKSLLKINMSDTFVPELDGLGFQDISMSEVCALPNFGNDGSTPVVWTAGTDPFLQSIGKQPAWMEYMTAVNEAHGDLSQGSLGYWILSRNFRRKKYNTSVGDDSTVYSFSPYILPSDFNYLFVDTDQYAQNFIVQCKFDLLAKRQISKNIRPNLG